MFSLSKIEEGYHAEALAVAVAETGAIGRRRSRAPVRGGFLGGALTVVS